MARSGKSGKKRIPKSKRPAAILFRPEPTDYADLVRTRDATGAPIGTQARILVHEALSDRRKLRAFKFIIREWTPVPSRPGCSANSCGAIVFAPNLERARELLGARNKANGSLPWEEVAPVVEIPMSVEGVALVVEV